MKNKIIYIVLGLIVVVGIGVLVENGAFKKNKAVEVEEIVNRISKIMEIPNEVPTAAKVTNKDLLRNQVFFKNCEKGDVLLIFSKANLAILYRVETGKIIEISQISAVNDVQMEEVKIKVAIYNGSHKMGQAMKLQNEIFDKVDNFEVVEKKDAKNFYNETIVVDISNSFPEVVRSLSENLRAKVTDLPVGEKKPEVDLLVIVGEN